MPTRERGRPKGSYTEHGRAQRVEVLGAIAEISSEQGYPPDGAQIARKLELSYSAVQHHLRTLREQGYVIFEDGQIGRTLKRTRKDPELERLR